jgi:integrase
VKGSVQYKTFETYKEAEFWQNELRFRRDKGTPLLNQKVTIQQMFDAYLEHAENKGLTSGTIKSAKSRYKTHILPGYGPHLDMTTVTYEEHQFFLSGLKKKTKGKKVRKTITPAMRNRIRTLLKTMYSVAIKQRLFGGAFTGNPFDSLECATELQKKIEYLSQEELEKFLQSNRDSHYYPLFILLFKTGLRIGEALGIHGEQIDTSTRILTVDRQFSAAANRIIPGTKNHRIRHIYLVDEVIEGLGTIGNSLPFRTTEGSPIRPEYFRKFILPNACDRAGVKRINPHATRHTFAAHYLMDGGSLWDLSKILGHSSTEVTEKRYGHFDLEHVRARMRVVERKGNILRPSFRVGGC